MQDILDAMEERKVRRAISSCLHDNDICFVYRLLPMRKLSVKVTKVIIYMSSTSECVVLIDGSLY